MITKKNKRGNEIITKYLIKQIIILIILFLFLVSLILVFARYATNNVKNFFSRSKAFYFFSDKLNKEGTVYEIDEWSGVDDYVITINMNSIKNNIEVASYDIPYNITYTATPNVICQLSKTEGIIYANTNSDFFNLVITPNAQFTTGDEVVVEIEVNSLAEYSKKLKGKFTLVVGQENLSYEIKDKPQSPYMDLSLTNTLSYYIIDEAFDDYSVGQRIDIDTYLALSETNKVKCHSSIVTLRFDPNVVLLDLTNENYSKATNVETVVIDNKSYINKLTVKIDAISSMDFRFYKTDTSQDYTYPEVNNNSIIEVIPT